MGKTKDGEGRGDTYTAMVTYFVREAYLMDNDDFIYHASKW